jgi:Ca2+-binding EF-hand superfamily protein
MISSISGLSSLTQSSMAQMRQQMFSKIDTNGDGKHDKIELAQMVANGPQGGPTVDDILSRFDTDGDGAISEAEFEAAGPPEQQMQGAGFPPMMGGMGGMSSADFLEQMFSNADADGDEKISTEEMSTVVSNAPAGGPTVKEIFDKLDTNEDGYVSKAEFEAGQPQETGSVQANSSEDKLLQALLEVLDKKDDTAISTSGDSTSSSSLAQLLAAIKSYTQSGISDYSQSDVTSMIGSTTLYA